MNLNLNNNFKNRIIILKSETLLVSKYFNELKCEFCSINLSFVYSRL
jgi:hypothetical protein